MPPLAFSVLGLSETLSILVVFAGGMLAVPVLFAAWVMLEDLRHSRNTEDWRDELTHPDGRAEAGTLLCDYVDDKVLASIAEQHEIAPKPDRRERGSSSARASEIGAAAKGLRGRFAKERRRDEREYFDDVEKFPDAMLRAVLEKLELKGDLDRSAGHAPVLGMDDATLDMVRDAKQGETVEELRERLLVGEKNRELAALVERSPFVLVESDWRVDRSGDEITMSLTKLKAPLLAYERYGAREPDESKAPTPVPEGVSITTVVPAGSVEGRAGGTRLVSGATINAGVLATVVNYRDDSGELRLLAIAVFGRHGGREPVSYAGGC